MSRSWGLGLALTSVVLVSAAQLGMRWSMPRLPLPGQWADIGSNQNWSNNALIVVALAVLAYILSMLCWLAALRDLPLSRAYSILSISYALVYLLAASLPVFNEQFSALKTLGVSLVIIGVLTINSRRTSSAPIQIPLQDHAP
jgi:undecaprenyl phosphate-alpha-L-ara4N flippase subunit ArnF